MLSRIVCFSLMLLSCVTVYGQQFGGYPPATRWRQLNTDTARVIYSAPAKYTAERVLSIIHRMAEEKPNLFGNNLQKVNIVLHTNTTLANGYVALAPFRSEFYLIPGGNIFEFGTLPWYEQLAVHEYRHVQQYNNFNRGLAKLATVVLGQEGRAIVNALSVPDWFFEGDAVYAETALTPQGRGRTPYFFNGYNALWREGRDYSWMKLRNGSLKDYVPNHYALGYLLVNYGYIKYGKDFWQKVTNDAVAFKGLVYPFQQAVKRHAGVSFKTFREAAIQYYNHQVSKRRTDKRTRETVAVYHHPQFIGEDSLLYAKISYKSTPAFYIQDKNGEHQISLRNITSEDWFSYRNGIIAYTSYNVDKRWSLKDYSDIVLLDIKTKKETKLTDKGKYFTPDISPSGNLIVGVYVNDSASSELHFINSKTGEVIRKQPAQNQSFFVQPRFIDENTVAVFEKLPDATMVLSRVDASGKIERLIPPAPATMGFPFADNNIIYFTSSFGGNDDLYTLNLKDKKVHKISSGQSGQYYPSVYKDSIAWSRFTSNGLRIQTSALSKMTRAEMNPMILQEQALPYAVAHADDTTNVLRPTRRKFVDTEYRKSFQLFNFHSWRPEYADPEFSFTLYSDNILNNFSNDISYTYNQNENSHGLGFNTSYGGLYPVLTAGAEYTYNRHFRPEDPRLTIDQLELQAGAYIPLNFTSGKTYKTLTFGSNYVFNRIMPTGILKPNNDPYNSSYLRHFANWSQRLPRAVQQIFPKFGYTAALEHRHRIEETGFQFLGSGQFYLPSIANHSIVLNGSIQVADTNNVNTGYFSNRFANSRGYDNYHLSKMWKLSANYHLPLVYPDFGLANIVYLLRVRGNLFYDFTKVYGKDRAITRNLRSTGAELLFDTKWWNALPVSFGVRYSYLLDQELTGITNRNVFEFIVPINLIPE